MLKHSEVSLACEKQDGGGGGSVSDLCTKEGLLGCELKEFPTPLVCLELAKGCSHG